jgi:hypothetical protein
LNESSGLIVLRVAEAETISCPDVLYGWLNPAASLVFVLDSFQANHDPPLRSPARDLELADVGFVERLVALLWAEPNEQGVLTPTSRQPFSIGPGLLLSLSKELLSIRQRQEYSTQLIMCLAVGPRGRLALIGLRT